VAHIRKSHAREYREALRDMPVRRLRTGKLRDATLPEVAQWGREHPEAQKIAATTINKLLGGVQAVGRWARSADLVTDDWSDPFADIRIDAEESKRAPLETKEPQAIFNTPVFTDGERPEGGQGEAAFWLPLLALFTGARLGELTGLRVSDVAHEELVGTHCIYIVSDAKAGRRIKTKQSAGRGQMGALVGDGPMPVAPRAALAASQVRRSGCRRAPTPGLSGHRSKSGDGLHGAHS
jgi:integrase